MSFQKHSTLVQNLKLSLKCAARKYKDLLDEDFETALMNEDIETLFNQYGTHVIVSAIYGGKLDFKYFLSSTDENTSASDISKIGGKISTEFLGFKASGDIKTDKSYKTEAENKNISVQMEINVVGGDQALSMRNEDEVNTNYTAWKTSLANPDKVNLIGLANQSSLYPIWNLCPDTDKGKARKNEILNYFLERIGNEYNMILENYSSPISRDIGGESFFLGEYPQTEASRRLSQTLSEKGSSIRSGTFDGFNILNYEGKKYIEYVCDNANNPYGYVKGNTYYFLLEPIKWKKLSDKYYIPNVLLDNKVYNKVSSDYIGYTYPAYKIPRDVVEEKGLITANTYEYSRLRKFLNNDFYQFVFARARDILVDQNYVSSVCGEEEDDNTNELAAEKKPLRDTITLPGFRFAKNGNDLSLTDFAKARGGNSVCFMGEYCQVSQKILPTYDSQNVIYLSEGTKDLMSYADEWKNLKVNMINKNPLVPVSEIEAVLNKRATYVLVNDPTDNGEYRYLADLTVGTYGVVPCILIK